MYIDSIIKRRSIEQVLLIDVLEHVQDDLKALKAINKILVNGGYLIISCPTPNFPFYFGMEFDKSIGHLRHYTFIRLKKLLEQCEFKILDYYYYSNSVTSTLCMIYYKILKNTIMRTSLMLLLNMLGIILEKESKHCRNCSSIAILAVKVKDVD